MKPHRSTIAAVSALAAVLFWSGAASADEKLIDAAKRGKLDEVQALIAGGANLDGGDKKGNTALMEAARTGKAEVVQALIEAGAALDAQNQDGWTAAMRAVMARQAETLTLLVDAGADVTIENEKGENALHVAIGNATANMRPEIVTTLAGAGIDPNAVTVRGKPALIYAIDSLQPNTVGALVKAGADPDVKDDKGRPAILLAAEQANMDQAPDMVALLMAGGADVDAQDEKGRTAIERAVDISKAEYGREKARGNVGKVVYILARGADPGAIRAARSIIWERGFALFDTLIVRATETPAARTADAAPAKKPRPRVPRPEGCPAASAVTSIASDNEDFAASLPIDLSRVASSRALAKNDGTRVRVFLANADFTAQQMDSSMVIPVKKKGQAVVVLNFMNGDAPVEPGEYTPAAGWGKPRSISAEVQVKGTHPSGSIIGFVSAGSRDEGSATITAMNEGWICGRFDVTGVLGAVAGEFAAELEGE